jgi:hypothetical protein
MTPRSGTRGAVNEVGAPSGTQIAVDVLKNAGTARQELRDFVRGLYTGDDGVTSPGLVFAADPLQVTTDLTQYKQDLRSWYSDAAFWIDMRRSARFWAQETYADARTWGVDAHAAERLPERHRGHVPHLFRLAGRSWTEVTTLTTRSFVCGKTRSLGTFAVFAKPGHGR